MQFLSWRGLSGTRNLRRSSRFAGCFLAYARCLRRFRPLLFFGLAFGFLALQTRLFLGLCQFGVLLGLLLGVLLGLAARFAFGLFLFLARLCLGESALLLLLFLRFPCCRAFLFQPPRFLLLAARFLFLPTRQRFPLQCGAIDELALAAKVHLNRPAASLVNLNHFHRFAPGNADLARHRRIPGFRRGLAVPVTQKGQQFLAGHIRHGFAGVVEAVSGALQLVHQVLHGHLQVLRKFGYREFSHARSLRRPFLRKPAFRRLALRTPPPQTTERAPP